MYLKNFSPPQKLRLKYQLRVLLLLNWDPSRMGGCSSNYRTLTRWFSQSSKHFCEHVCTCTLSLWKMFLLFCIRTNFTNFFIQLIDELKPQLHFIHESIIFYLQKSYNKSSMNFNLVPLMIYLFTLLQIFHVQWISLRLLQ